VRSEKKEGVRLSEWFVLCLVMVCATLFSRRMSKFTTDLSDHVTG